VANTLDLVGTKRFLGDGDEIAVFAHGGRRAGSEDEVRRYLVEQDLEVGVDHPGRLRRGLGGR